MSAAQLLATDVALGWSLNPVLRCQQSRGDPIRHSSVLLCHNCVQCLSCFVMLNLVAAAL